MKRSWIGLFLVVALAAAVPANATLESARELAAQGDPASALEVVEVLLAEDPEAAGALFLKGVLLVELRRADEAVTVFERLIELYPELPEPYNNLAVVQAAGGDYEAAVETLRGSLRTNSSYRTAYENLTKIYSQLASEAYSEALDSEAGERADVVELVLLGTLVKSPVDAEPKPEGRIAATEPTAVSGTEPSLPSTPPSVVPEPNEPDLQVEEITEVATEAPLDTPAAPTIAPFVESWRAAWQAQDADAYLASYAGAFTPADGLPRAEWESLRRQRLSAPEFIRVTLAFLDEPVVTGERAEIRFLQSYESNTFQDRVTKTLILTWEDSGWKILEERSE